MLVKCQHCGGENTVHPGQRMLFCSFCGSALVVERSEGPEHLILPHERSDRKAGDALRSYLLSKGRGKAVVTKVDFAFVPYLLLEDGKGATGLVPATGSIDIPYPPAGNYRFFDGELAGGERVVPLAGPDEGIEGEGSTDEPGGARSGNGRSGEQGGRSGRSGDDRRTVKILHLPLYTVDFKCGRFEGRASVVGGSWYVGLSDLPVEGQAEFEPKHLLALAALFTLFLLIGAAAPNWAMRFVYIFLSAAVGYGIFRIRERVVSGS